MNLSGSVTFAVETEEDIILVAQLLQQKRQSARPTQKQEEREIPWEGGLSGIVTDADVINCLRAAFPTGQFTRAQADEAILKLGRVSVSKMARIMRKCIGQGMIKRLETGIYTFDGCRVASGPSPFAGRQRKRKAFSKKHLSILKTLENPLLYFNFVRKLRDLNPGGIDEQLIDRTLEPREALADMKKRYPDLVIYKEGDRDFKHEFREYMAGIGIDDPNVQDLVIARMEGENPFTDAELKAFAKAQRSAMQELPTVVQSV